jgi:methylthioribose-1-phosphate isomerase
LADPPNRQATITPTAPAAEEAGSATVTAGSADANGSAVADAATDADLGRRRFFRQFAGDIATTAATVVGAAQALQRTSAEMAAAILDPTRAALGDGTTSATAAVLVAEPVAGPLFRTAFQVDPGAIRFVDQRALPAAVVEHVATTAAEVIFAIRNEVVVGGPAIGQVAAVGFALTAARAATSKPFPRKGILLGAANALRNSSPTTASLGWALDRVLAAYAAAGELDEDGEAIAAAIQAEADAIVGEALVEHGQLVEVGLALLEGMPAARGPSDDAPGGPLRLLVHGPSGTLAGGQFGTALAIAIAAHHSEREVEVVVPEGRPGLIGARITCWELAGAGVTYTLVPDAAAAGLVAAGRVDAILVPADRVAANGDVAAAIGSYGLAAAAAQRGIPFLVCATIGSLDAEVASGAELPVGSREVADLIRIGEAAHAPAGVGVLAPVDDVVPAGLVSEYITASGLGLPAFLAVAS